jgi:hypothetical protein
MKHGTDVVEPDFGGVVSKISSIDFFFYKGIYKKNSRKSGPTCIRPWLARLYTTHLICFSFLFFLYENEAHREETFQVVSLPPLDLFSFSLLSLYGCQAPIPSKNKSRIIT